MSGGPDPDRDLANPFRSWSGSSRAVSDVVGVALLIGLVIVGATAVFLFGASAIDQGKDQATLEHAEQSMRALDAQASRVTGSGASRDVDLGLTGSPGSIHHSSDAWLRVTLTTHGGSHVLANQSLATVAYRQQGTAIAYQGGGVFRSDDGHGLLLSPPDVEYDDRTLTVTATSLDGTVRSTGPVRISRGATRKHFPGQSAPSVVTTEDDGEDDTTNLERLGNPLNTAQVSVTVHSQYYEGWGAYFETELDGRVSYDHGAETVTVVLRSLDPPIGTAGIIATSSTGELALAGTGAYTDSYNSDVGSYAATRSNGGTVEAAGDVYVNGDATLRGDLNGGQTVTLDGTAQVDGDVHWTSGYDGSGDASISGEVSRISGVDALPPMGGVVDKTVDRIQGSNDNGATGLITGEELSIPGSSGELSAGTYYFEEFDLRGKELVLNTTDGDIEIAVQDWLRVVEETGSDGQIRVVGDGDVRLFVSGEESVTVSPTGLGSRSVNMHVGKGSTVRVPNHDASQFVVYAPSSFNATITGSQGKQSVFDGVVYAPAGRDGVGWVYVKQADVYGAVVTGDLTVGQYGAIHFDRGIVTEDGRAGPSEIDFLHVIEREIRIED